MTITYPLDLNTLLEDFTVARITIGSVRSQMENRSFLSLNSQVQDWQGDLWTLQAEFPRMLQAQFRRAYSFFKQLRGMEGTFTYGDPKLRLPRGLADGTPVVASGEGNFITVTGWVPDVGGVLLPGDLVSIGTRTHVVADEANSDVSGASIVEIWPRLRENVTPGTPLTLKDCKILWRLASPEVSYSLGNDGLYTLALDAVEAR